jgi:CubicO group peptidase (beta-lactamase class C family)
VKTILQILAMRSVLAVSFLGASGTNAASPIESVMAAAEQKEFSGVVLVGDDRTVLFGKAIGFADKSKKLPHTIDMTWRWASVSKQVTALVAAQLVAEGALSLDKTVADYLSTKQFGGRDRNRITIRQLLQHTSGLPNPDDAPAGAMPPPDGMSSFYRTRISPDRVHAKSAAVFCAGMPKRTPGEQFEYNNCDYLVLGAVIERVTGKSYAQVVATRIAQPLKLSTLAMASSEKAGGKSVQGYLNATRSEPTFALATFGAAGAMIGSPRDLLALDRTLMGDSLISAEMKREFWKGEPKLGYAALGVWSFPAPLKGCNEPVDLIERRGEIGGVQVRNIIAPKMRKAIVVFVNRADWEFGEIWQGSGFSHDLLSAALCSATAS